MQLQNHFVNRFVVKYLSHYKICSFRTRRSDRDYKVNVYGGLAACAAVIPKKIRQDKRLDLFADPLVCK